MSALSEMQLNNCCTTLSLALFTLEEVQTLVTAVLDAGASTERSAHVIWEMTDGWPLYAEQVDYIELTDYAEVPEQTRALLKPLKYDLPR